MYFWTCYPFSETVPICPEVCSPTKIFPSIISSNRDLFWQLHPNLHFLSPAYSLSSDYLHQELLQRMEGSYHIQPAIFSQKLGYNHYQSCESWSLLGAIVCYHCFKILNTLWISGLTNSVSVLTTIFTILTTQTTLVLFCLHSILHLYCTKTSHFYGPITSSQNLSLILIHFKLSRVSNVFDRTYLKNYLFGFHDSIPL